MAAAVTVFSLFALCYGLLRPNAVIPDALGKASRWKVVGLYGVLAVAGSAFVGDDGPEGTQKVEAVSDEATDRWPGGAPARDSAFSGLAAMISAGRYAEATDSARALAARPYADGWTDRLDSLAAAAEEGARYERAVRLPSSDLEGNRDAYAELARLYPDSPRSALYAEKQATYTRRIAGRTAARARSRSRSSSGRGSRSGGCCKRCANGQPCGDSCISWSYTCRRPPGCAC